MQEQVRDDLELPPYLWGQMGLTQGCRKSDHESSIIYEKVTVIRRYSDDWQKVNIGHIFKKARSEKSTEL